MLSSRVVCVLQSAVTEELFVFITIFIYRRYLYSRYNAILEDDEDTFRIQK